MKYVIYLRVSTKKQDMRTQLDYCIRFLKAHHGGTFQYLVFQDEITTRKAIKKREGFQSAMAAIQPGDVLVAMRLDRLSRNLYEITGIINDLDIKKAEAMLVDQPGIKNKVMLGLYAGMAEEEVKLIRRRVKEKLTAKVYRGERTNISMPYGKSLDMENLIPIKNKDGNGVTMKPGILLENAQELHALDLMCTLFDAGLSYDSVCRELTNRGYLNRAGKPFQQTSVLRILNRTGRHRPKDRVEMVPTFDLLHA